MSQTTFPTSQSAGFAGMLADAGLRDVITRINEEAAEVLFGLGVQQGTGDKLFKKPTTAAQEIIGATLHSHAYDNAGLVTEAVPVDSPGDIIKRGRIFVTAETDVTDGAQAFCRIDDGVADAAQTTKGGWGADDDSGTRRRVEGAKFRTTGSKGDIVTLELSDNLSATSATSLARQVGEDDDLAYSMVVGEGDDIIFEEAVAALSATGTVDLGSSPAGRTGRLQSVQVTAGMATQDDTDHWTIAVLADAVSLAIWDTDTAVDGGITQNVPTELNLVAGAVIPADARLTAVFTKIATGTTLSAGTITMNVQTDVLTETTTFDLGSSPAARSGKVASIQLAAGVTVQDNTDHWTIEVLADAVSLATWDSDTAVDGAITQNVPTELNLVAGAVIPADARLTAVFTKVANATTITQGSLTLNMLTDALTETTTVRVGSAPADRHMVVKSVMLDLGIAAGDATDHWVIQLRQGATVVATWDTDTAVDGALVLATPQAMNVTAANAIIDPGDPVTLVLTKNAAAVSGTSGNVTVHSEMV